MNNLLDAFNRDTVIDVISGSITGTRMFSLFRGLWNYFFKKDQIFILIVGLNNAGKTVAYRVHIRTQNQYDIVLCL